MVCLKQCGSRNEQGGALREHRLLVGNGSGAPDAKVRGRTQHLTTLRRGDARQTKVTHGADGHRFVVPRRSSPMLATPIQ